MVSASSTSGGPEYSLAGRVAAGPVASNNVKKTAGQYADFKFRVALAKTELQIDSRPSQTNVMRFLQHLLAELEQLGGGSRKPGSTTTATSAGTGATTTTPRPSLNGMQQGTEDAKAKSKATPPTPKKACQWFGTDVGCKNSKACSFVHSWQGLTRAERCCLMEASSTGQRTVQRRTRQDLQQGCHQRHLQRQRRLP